MDNIIKLLRKWILRPKRQFQKPYSKIKLKKLSKAYLNDYKEEVLVLSSMKLIYRGETASKIYFRVVVPEQYPPRQSQTEAKEGQIIYFYKDYFSSLEIIEL